MGGVSQHALRQTPALQTATAADGTHPTGMHSCLLRLMPLISRDVCPEFEVSMDPIAL